MANKKFKDGNTLDSSQIYNSYLNMDLSTIISYIFVGHNNPVTDLDLVTDVGINSYTPTTANIPSNGYGVILNILNLGAIKTNTNWLFQIALDTNNLIFMRVKINASPWSTWKQVL